MKIFLPIAAAIFFSTTMSPVSADYLLVLKNGRQITVQNYREDGSVIKFYGFGGEIGIGKDQLQSITEVGRDTNLGLTVSAGEVVTPSGEGNKSRKATPESTPERASIPDQERERLEKDDQQKLIEITEKVEEAQRRYLESVRGTASPEPNLQVSEEQRAASQDDVISRFRDATANPSQPAPVRLLTPSPFSSLPPTIVEHQPASRPPISVDNLPTTDRQRELSDLRNQAVELEKERERLIKELREKNLSTGSSSVE